MGNAWGYIDTRGRLAIQPHFSSAGSFVDGLALVETGAYWSYIDYHGSVVSSDVFRTK